MRCLLYPISLAEKCVGTLRSILSALWLCSLRPGRFAIHTLNRKVGYLLHVHDKDTTITTDNELCVAYPLLTNIIVWVKTNLLLSFAIPND